MSTSFEARIVLRPRSLDETFDLALAYLRTSPRDFLPLFAGLVAVPTALLIGLSMIFDLTWGQRACLALVISPVLERVVTVHAGRHLFQNQASIGFALKAVLKQLPLILATGFFDWLPISLMLWGQFEEEGLVGLGGFLALFWPFITTLHLYLGEVSHLEQLPLARTAKRARSLVMNRYGRALGVAGVGFVVRLLFALGTYCAGLFVLGFMLQIEEVSSNLGEWSAIAGFFAAAPYLALVRLFDYVDARTRREGWDIQVRFNAIAQRERDAQQHRTAA